MYLINRPICEDFFMWHSISLNADLIKFETARAMLIGVPGGDDQFWHPKKCVRFIPAAGLAMRLIKVSIADDMVIKTHRPGTGSFSNSTVKLDERQYTAAEFIERVKDHCVSANVAKPSVKVGDMSGLVDLLRRASSHLKWPKFRVRANDGDVVVSLAGSSSKNAGWLYVKTPSEDGSVYLGKVNPANGEYVPSRDASDDIEGALEQFSKDPAKVAADYGKLTGNCCFCSRPLSDERSTAVGYGATCADHYGLPWGQGEEY